MRHCPAGKTRALALSTKGMKPEVSKAALCQSYSQGLLLFFVFKIIFICFVCAWRVSRRMSGSGDDFWGQFFLATTWVLRLKLRSADLVASALDHWAILLAYFDAMRLGLWENHRPKHFMQPLSDTASCPQLELWFSTARNHSLHFSAPPPPFIWLQEQNLLNI